LRDAVCTGQCEGKNQDDSDQQTGALPRLAIQSRHGLFSNSYKNEFHFPSEQNRAVPVPYQAPRVTTLTIPAAKS
jgi:hypothetical protein